MMNSQELKQFNLPDTPGVYYFRAGNDILYIGKATSLRDRVRSYFNADLINSRGPGIVSMLDQADSVTFTETDSVLEALILESLEIKKYRPKYNVREKDDKSYNFVVITKEDYPRVLLVRGKELAENEDLHKQIKYKFGPFPFGSELKEALKIVRKIFPYRTRCKPEVDRACFDAQIGLCPGVCSGAISKLEYQKTIRNIKRFFEGKKREVTKDLEKEMKLCAKNQNFEQASVLRNKIFSLNHIHDVALIKRRKEERATDADVFRVEAYDIAHLGGKDTVGVMTVVENGEPKPALYRKFKIRGAGADQANDILNLKEVLTRRFNHPEWRMPDLIVIDGGQAQLNMLNKVVTELGLASKTNSVVKDEYHRPKEILGSTSLRPRGASGNNFIQEHEHDILLANSEAHRFAIKYHRQLRGRML